MELLFLPGEVGQDAKFEVLAGEPGTAQTTPDEAIAAAKTRAISRATSQAQMDVDAHKRIDTEQRANRKGYEGSIIYTI